VSRRGSEGDPIEQLRRADPLNRLEVPNDASGVRARALFQEVTSMDVMEQEPVKRRRAWARPVALTASAVAVVAMAVGGYAVFGQNDEAPEAIVGAPLGNGAAMCIQYEDAILLGLAVAFDGTLVSVETVPGSGDIDFPQNLATFEVHRWFRGGEGTEVTLDAGILVDDGSIALVGTQLEVGERYLISGDDGFVWACGYSYSYDTEVAEHWAELFGA
jgi:hypothetical protein